MKSVLRIDEMCCTAEEQVIRNRFAKVSEVEALSFDLVNRLLTIEHRFESDEPLRKIIKSIGMSPRDNCGSDCAVPRRGIAREDVMLGIALVLAIGAEGIAYATGNESSPPVLGTSLLAIGLGGVETFKRGLMAVRTFTLNINFLMCLAVIGAFAIGSYPEAAMVTVLFAIAERVESFALERASNAVKSLLEMAPDTAFRQDASGAWSEVSAAEIEVGDVLRVKPGERIALDGEVVNGESSVNQAPITGESTPVDKSVGATIFAGTINGEGILEYRVTGTSGHTTLDRIIATVQEAQGARAPTQRFIDSFAQVYTPIVVAVAVLIATVPLVFGQPFQPWLYKALVLLVIACPCALVISTPVTVVSALTGLARAGILVKGGVHLESGRKLSMVALDKTGTLTHGTPKATDLRVFEGYDETRAKQIAASIDHLSGHPVAKAITALWEGEILPVDDFRSVTGRGVVGKVNGMHYSLGNHRLIEESGLTCEHVHETLAEFENTGATTVLLADEKVVLAVFAVADSIRPESVEAVRQMREMGLKVAMLTGDNPLTAKAIGTQAGITDIRAELLPEDKLRIIEELLASERGVGMVGDGVNDAPALARSTVGFAMGAAGTDTAIETADVALMDDDLRKLPTYIRASRKAATVLTQNITFALALKVVFFGLALTDRATLWMAVFADMGASLVVVGNGLRMLKYH